MMSHFFHLSLQLMLLLQKFDLSSTAILWYRVRIFHVILMRVDDVYREESLCLHPGYNEMA